MPELVSLLPPNSTGVERAVEQAVRLDLPPLPSVWSPALCPPELLGHLAWGLSVDVWRDDWPVDVKRAVCASSLTTHALAGTPAAVRASLGALGFATDLIEWFAPGGSGQPFTCRVDCYADGVIGAGGTVDAALVALISGIVSVTAPARVHFTVRVGECLSPAPIALRAGVRERAVERAPIEPGARTHAAPAAIAIRAACRDRAIWRHTHDVQRAAA
ncbi:MAG: phage tail protein I [Hyphomonadaceae bacterium]|jgi:phage tail P2-like protein|nr:phage tail protein I [Hyphomonadaceae bacterium]